MSTTICTNKYEYQGQVYSPAFSEPSSPAMSTSSMDSTSQPPSPKRKEIDDYEEESYVSKRPKFANKYEEMLQPLCPVKTLKYKVPKRTHQSAVNSELQDQFQNLISVAAIEEIEDFLAEHLASLDINQFNYEGRTALQQCCLEGNLPLAKVLVKYGANTKIMTRDGFSLLHLVVFSGHSHLMTYVMSLR